MELKEPIPKKNSHTKGFESVERILWDEEKGEKITGTICGEGVWIEGGVPLRFEEAYYMAYERGRLELRGEDGGPMAEEAAWASFRGRRPAFPLSYAAYRHFARKGWRVASGLKFGADFLLYKKGPQFHHASFALLVRSDKSPVRWLDVLTGVRLSAANNKDLLTATVTFPDDNVDGPAVLKDVIVRETLMRRWAKNQRQLQT